MLRNEDSLMKMPRQYSKVKRKELVYWEFPEKEESIKQNVSLYHCVTGSPALSVQDPAEL